MAEELSLEVAEKWTKVEKYKLDDEVQYYSTKYITIADMKTKTKGFRDHVKTEIDDVFAVVASEYRVDYAEEHGKKPTESMVKEHVILDCKYKAACSSYEELRLETEYWENREKGYGKKDMMIRQMCELHREGYFKDRKVKDKEMQNEDRVKAARVRISRGK